MDQMQHKQLVDRLEAKGWQDKISLYGPDYEYSEILNEVYKPEIAAVLIAWKFNQDIIKNVTTLASESGIRKQIVFVDNGSQPGEMDVVKPYVDVYVRLNRNTGAYLARNVGSLFSDAPIIAFIDDDAIPEKNLLESHIKAHTTYDVISVRGVVRPKTDNPLNNMAGHYYLGPNPFPVFSDIEGNVSYNAKMFYDCKGWDDGILFGGGGIEFSRRMIEYDSDMRKQIYYPDAVIYHDYAVNEEHIVSKKEKQEKSRERLRRKFPDIDLYIQQWNKTFLRTDLLIKKEIFSEPSQKHKQTISSIIIRPGTISEIKKTLYSIFRDTDKTIKLYLPDLGKEAREDLTRLVKRQGYNFEFFTENEQVILNQISANSVVICTPGDPYKNVINHRNMVSQP